MVVFNILYVFKKVVLLRIYLRWC